MKKPVGLALGLLLALLPSAFAQQTSGAVYGKVTDESGAVLPGAAVTITGPTIAPRSTVSGTQGDFRFLNLDFGTYKVSVSLTGFTTVNRQVIVSTGGSLDLTFGLKVATVEETVTVTAETPIVDTKKIGTGTTLTKEELSQVPNSRDPWAVLRTIPGVVVDRVNIAGNESGQQSSFQGKGSETKDSMWSLDGVVITDMAAIGASPTYFDYDAFDEITVGTGGNDLKVATGGIGLNFVTKRGTNNFHGALRGYFTHRDLQTTNIPDELKRDARLGAGCPTGTSPCSDKADHIDQVADFGADLGGPIIKDKLWFWGSYGKQDIRNVRTNQTKDRTVLKDYNAKLNWQATSSDMFSVFYFLGGKEKYGRASGAAANEPDSFLWNQGGAYPEDGILSPIHGLIKLEDNHVFSPNFFVNAKYAYYGTGFGLTPRGGDDKDGGVDRNNGVGVGSYLTYLAIRPQHTVNVDANLFKTALGGNHEFKFGFGYRKTPVESITAFSGSSVFAFKDTATSGYAIVYRDRVAKYETKYVSAYLGDTFTKNRLTLNLGARFDRQSGGNLPSEAEANPAFPELLPALQYPGGGQGVEWTDVSPRVSMTYALDESRKTVLRASYARYAGQLSSSDASYDNPLGSPSYLAYNWVDLNGDKLAQKNEVLIGQGIQYYGYVDPANPTKATSVAKIDPNYKSNKDNEVIVGIDRELAANFSISAAYTWRKTNSITGWLPRIGATSADYTANAPFTRNGFSAFSYSTSAAVIARGNGGRILTNRPDFSRSYGGIETTLMKRLSNKWMARVGFSYMNWTENLEGPGAVVNPTKNDVSGGTTSGPQVDGGQVSPRSGGSGKGDIFFSPKWQFIASALYQLPAGFEVATSVFGRQGYPRPIILTRPSSDGTQRVLATSLPEIDATRYPNLWNIDIRASKNLKIAGSTALVVTADVFNLLNNDVELNRTRNANSATFNRLDEVLSPRVVRFGLRFTF